MALHPLSQSADEFLVNTAPAADEVIDLTDRRRLFVRIVLGLDVSPTQIDELFEPDAEGAPTLT